MLITLLCAPSATASLINEKLNSRMIIAILISLFNSLVGLYISYVFDIASGASIVIFSALIYFIVFNFTKLLKKNS